MGLVIATGMSIGTVFTLFVVPMFYTFIAKDKRAVAKTPSPMLAQGSPAQPV
jgi:multidrug efflux pump